MVAGRVVPVIPAAARGACPRSRALAAADGPGVNGGAGLAVCQPVRVSAVSAGSAATSTMAVEFSQVSSVDRTIQLEGRRI
jgi:hypothetical protein